MMPGSTRAYFSAAFISVMPCMYFEKSRTTATLQHWPASDVPPPRARIGAPCLRAKATAAMTSSAFFGNTTPMGTCR